MSGTLTDHENRTLLQCIKRILDIIVRSVTLTRGVLAGECDSPTIPVWVTKHMKCDVSMTYGSPRYFDGGENWETPALCFRTEWRS